MKMKRSLFRLLTVSLSVIAISILSSAVFAQGNGNGGGNNGGGGDPPPTINVGYRIHWEFGPVETTEVVASDNALKTDANGVPITAFVVGYYSRVDRDRPSAFAYVMGNPANPNDDQANRFWDIEELVGSTPNEIPWATTETPISSFQSNFRQVNASGLVAGYVVDPQGMRRGVYLDLNEETPELRLIPEPPNPYDRYEGEDVSSTGDILVHYYRAGGDPNGVVSEAYVFRPSTGEIFMIEDVNTNQPIQFAGRDGIHLNSFGQVVGQRADGMAIRHFLDSGFTVPLPAHVQVGFGDNLVNDSGQIATTRSVSTTIKKRVRTQTFAVRVGADDSLEWISSNPASTVITWTINNQGDVLYFRGYSPLYYYNESLQQEFFVGDLIIPESDPNGWFTGNEGLQMRLTEVDETGFGWLTPAISSSGGIAILIPEILP